MNRYLSRRHFLQSSALILGSLGLRPWRRLFQLPDFPQADQLGRVFSGRVPVYARPDVSSQEVSILNEDDVVPWLKEVVGSRPLWNTQRFVDTGNGFVYAPNLQPVMNEPNTPLTTLLDAGDGTPGMWAEVTVPYVDLVLDNPPARSPWLGYARFPRLYYSQVMWIDSVRTDEAGAVWYRVKEKYGTFGDVFWARAEAFRPVTAEDLTPIHPDVEDKYVEVDLTYQTMSCFESGREVYFARISSGGKFDAEGNPTDTWSTPVGSHSIWRKMVSVHMTGGTTGGGYDLPGIGWTMLFSGNGVAIHSTFWHNSFGAIMSHGCVNARPEDAKWVFRWTLPDTPYLSGDVTISGRGSSKVNVVEK